MARLRNCRRAMSIRAIRIDPVKRCRSHLRDLDLAVSFLLGGLPTRTLWTQSLMHCIKSFTRVSWLELLKILDLQEHPSVIGLQITKIYMPSDFHRHSAPFSNNKRRHTMENSYFWWNNVLCVYDSPLYYGLVSDAKIVEYSHFKKTLFQMI